MNKIQIGDTVTIPRYRKSRFAPFWITGIVQHIEEKELFGVDIKFYRVKLRNNHRLVVSEGVCFKKVDQPH